IVSRWLSSKYVSTVRRMMESKVCPGPSTGKAPTVEAARVPEAAGTSCASTAPSVVVGPVPMLSIRTVMVNVSAQVGGSGTMVTLLITRLACTTGVGVAVGGGGGGGETRGRLRRSPLTRTTLGATQPRRPLGSSI